MKRLGLFVLAEIGLLEIDLILQGQLVVFVDRPDGPAHRGQGGNHAGEKLAIEFARRQALLRQLRNFIDQRLDLLTRLFDQLLVDRLVNTAHGV